MNTRAYSPARDYETLVGWWKGHGQDAVDPDNLPGTGFITDFAACFVLKTDTRVCFIEGAISDPSASFHDRDLAVDEVVERCIEYARSSGFLQLLVLTHMRRVIDRACTRHGFRRPLENMQLIERNF